MPAIVLERTGPVSYSVETAEHQLWKRHVDQLKTLADSVVVEGQELASTGPAEDADFEIPQPAPVALTTPPDSSGDPDPLSKIPDNPDPPQSPDPIHPSTGQYIPNVIELNHCIMVTVTMRVQAKCGGVW